MAVTSDGTQSFGIEVSPVTINSVDYVAEDFNVTYAGNRVDINDSNGEPLGSTTVPQRVEFSATVQYATASTANPSIGQEMVYLRTQPNNLCADRGGRRPDTGRLCKVQHFWLQENQLSF